MGVGVKVDGVMVLTGLGVVAAGYVYYKKKQIIQAVNPASDKNLIYSGITDALSSATGKKDYTLGKAIADNKNTNVFAKTAATFFDWIGHTTGQLP